MAKAYTFDDIIKRNEKIATTPLSELYKDNGDAAQGEILDVPSQTRDQAADQAAAKALYTSGSQYKTPKTLIPGMTYTEWLMKGGMNGQAQKEYDAAVRAAETDYAKTLALYGQNAETLGRAGLTGSGYTDYLTGAGFSAMQGAKVAAADTKALTEAQQRLSYADYLAGVDAQNAQLAAQETAKQEALAAEQEATAASIKGTIDKYMQQGMDDKSIMAMIQQHYGNDFDSYLSGWIANAHTYLDPLLAQNTTATADSVAAEYRQAIYDRLIAGEDAAAIRGSIEFEMKNAGVDTSQLDAWFAEAQAAAQPTVDKLNAEKTAADKSAALNAYLTMISGGLDKATALDQLRDKYSDDIVNYAVQTYETSQANIKSDAQTATFKQYSDALDLKGLTLDQIGTADEYHNLAVAGQITQGQAKQLTDEAIKKRFDLLEAQFKDLGDMDEESVSQAMADWRAAVDAFSAEDLPDFQRAQLYGMLGDALLSGNIELKKPVSEMLNDIRELDKTQIGEAAYNGVVDAFLDAVTISNTASKTDKISYGGTSGYKYAIKIDCGKRENGKEAVQQIKFVDTSAPEDTQKSLKELGPLPLDGEIRSLNNRLYVYEADKKQWKSLLTIVESTVAGGENAELMYDMLVRYYSAGIRNGQDFPSEKHKNAIK